MNSKIDVTVNMYSLDFYQSTQHPDYVREFIDTYNEAESRRIFAVNEFIQIYVTAFYFTSCNNCDFQILTNIRENRPINCRNCATRFASKAVRSKHLDKLLKGIETALGKQKLSFQGHFVFVLVQCEDNPQMEEIRPEFTAAGYEQIVDYPYFVYNIMGIGIEKNLFTLGPPFILFKTKCISPIFQYQGDTPLEVEELIIQLRMAYAGFKSMSVTMTEQDIKNNPMQVKSFTERADCLLEMDLAGGLDYTQMLTLIDALMQSHRYDEGRIYLKKAFQMMPEDHQLLIMLGRIELYTGEYQKALNYFLRYYQRNPIDRYNLSQIVAAYRQLGDDNNYWKYYNELQILGGPF